MCDKLIAPCPQTISDNYLHIYSHVLLIWVNHAVIKSVNITSHWLCWAIIQQSFTVTLPHIRRYKLVGEHLSLWLEHLPLWLERSLSAMQSDFHFRMSILIFVVAVIGHGYSTTTAKYMWGINFPFGVLIMSLILQHCLIGYSELIQNFMPIFLSPVLSA